MSQETRQPASQFLIRKKLGKHRFGRRCRGVDRLNFLSREDSDGNSHRATASKMEEHLFIVERVYSSGPMRRLDMRLDPREQPDLRRRAGR